MAALIDLVGAGEIAPGSTVLYAHLGGQPALNAVRRGFRSAVRVRRASAASRKRLGYGRRLPSPNTKSSTSET
jgi:hypothetical protein